ncbi:MAG: glycosyltransferase [Sedimentisphaerales bacterium]|nr:glycosyltransferase [Sedimentisphaerales bacterium]
MDFLKFGKKVFTLRLLYDAVSYLDLKNFDIIKCHFGPNGVFAARLSELGIIRGKLVTMFHGYDIRRGMESSGKIYKELFNKGDCFLAISDFSYRSLIDFGADAGKIKVHPVGIDLDNFSFRWNGSKVDTSKIIILTVARLVEEKGLKYGIEALSILLKSKPDLKLEYRIIGDGPLRGQLEELVGELGLCNIVSFLGSMNRKEVAEHLNNAHIFLLPSVAEILPVSLIEAQAAGLPAVATSIGSVGEIISDGKTGFIVPAREPYAVAEKLLYLIEHKELWPEMGRLARRHIESKYDINKLNDRLVNIYQEILTK